MTMHVTAAMLKSRTMETVEWQIFIIHKASLNSLVKDFIGTKDMAYI